MSEEDKFFNKYIKYRGLYRSSRVEIGKLESELDESRDNVEKLKKALSHCKKELVESKKQVEEAEAKIRYDLEVDREGMIAVKKEKEYQILKTTVDNMRKRIKTLIASNRDLVNKNVRLERKQI